MDERCERPAVAEDLPLLLPWGAELTAGDERVFAQAFHQALRPPAEAWVIAEARGKPVGLCALTPSAVSSCAGFLEWLRVPPAPRPPGVGRPLVALALRRSAERGWRQLHVYTFGENRPSLHLYLDMGFLPVATWRDFRGPGRHYVQLCWEAGGDLQGGNGGRAGG